MGSGLFPGPATGAWPSTMCCDSERRARSDVELPRHGRYVVTLDAEIGDRVRQRLDVETMGGFQDIGGSCLSKASFRPESVVARTHFAGTATSSSLTFSAVSVIERSKTRRLALRSPPNQLHHLN